LTGGVHGKSGSHQAEIRNTPADIGILIPVKYANGEQELPVAADARKLHVQAA
jgi:hypothetical protein